MAEQLNFFINQKIQVSTKFIDEWFNSSIQDISRDVISISFPYLQEYPLVLHRGDAVQVRLASENAFYSFTTNVIGEAIDNIKLYKLAYPEEVQRIQQRLYVRLPVVLDVQYAVLRKDKKSLEYCNGSMVDLSGGGLKLAVREKIKENTRLLVVFNLPLRCKPELLKLNALVIRSQLVDQERTVYHMGAKFIDINHRQEDMIVRFIFERMAQQKRLR